MNRISLQDTFKVRATALGRVVADFNATGFNNLTELLNDTCRRIGGTRGMVSISLRNCSQGWTTSHALYI